MNDFRLPNDSERLTIIGRTGSGKTQAGIWHLARRSWDKMPWVILNFKGDELLLDIQELGAKEIDISSAPPKKPGLYIANVLPDNDADMEIFLRRIWERQHMGLYVDEGYMIKTRSKWFRALLTQGRSRRCPIITLSQRPNWLDRFVFTEGDFTQVFHLSHAEDRKTAENFVPFDMDEAFNGPNRLGEFHSIYYNVKSNNVLRLAPVPDRGSVLQMFAERLQTRRHFL